MNGSRFVAMFVLLAMLAFGNNAFAQKEAPTALTNGVHSLSFAVPSGGNPYAPGTLGYWMMLTNEFNLGINFGLALDRQGDGTEDGDVITTWDLLLAPAIKYYTSRARTVAPYYYAQLNFRIFSDGVDYSEIEGEDGPGPEIGIAGGIGVEWFPVPNFSIGGHVGVGIDIVRQEPAEPVALGTFTSGLTAQIYF